MTAEARVQIRRKVGSNLQRASLALNGLPAAHVGRSGLGSGLFGNPFKVTETTTAAAAVKSYRDLLLKWSDSQIIAGIKFADGSAAPMQGLGFIAFRNTLRANIHHLRGHNLGCHCAPGSPCHADVLLEILRTNKPEQWKAKYPKIADRISLPGTIVCEEA